MKRKIVMTGIAAALAASASCIFGGVALADDGSGALANANCGNPTAEGGKASQCNAPVIIFGPGSVVGSASNGGEGGGGSATGARGSAASY